MKLNVSTMKKALLSTVLFVFEITVASNLLNIIPATEEENLFHDINVEVQDIIDKLFTLLKLEKHFIEQNETRLLLTTLASLKQISEDKYYIYKNMTNASRLDITFNEFINSSLFKLDKPIDEIVAENFTAKTGVRKQDDMDLNMDSVEIPDDSDEAIAFLGKYLNNIDHIELSDLTKPSQKIKAMYEKHKQFRYARRRNLKVWKPSKSTEQDLGTRRVFKGNQVRIRKFPFVASIHVNNKFVCTGAVVSRNMIITAACCLHEASFNSKFLQSNPHSIFVRVGSEYPDFSGEWIETSNVFIHPNYESSTMMNNIAILQIKKHLHLKKRNRKIRRIEYQRMKGGLPNSVHDVVLLGWGDKEYQKSQLSYSHLKMYKLQDCVEMYSNRYVTEKNFCAGFSGRGAGACQQDVGGPAIVSNVLVGVVSFGPPVCGSPHAPTVFTNIGHHVDWIESIVEGKKSEGVIIPTPPSSPSFINRPAIGDVRQISRSTFTDTPGTSSMGYSKSLSLLSNLLRDLMLQGERQNENSFNMRPYTNLWNTTTAAVTMKSSQQHRNRHNLMQAFNMNIFSRTRADQPTQITTRPMDQGRFQMKPFDFFSNPNNFSIGTIPGYSFQTPNMLRYGNAEAGVTKATGQEESSSYSDDYESDDEVGMEIEIPTTLRSVVPLRMALYAPQSYNAPQAYNTPKTFNAPQSYNAPQSFNALQPFNAPQSYDTPQFYNTPQSNDLAKLPSLLSRDLSLTGPNIEDSVELIKYFVKNKLAPISSQLGLPINDFEAKAEEFLIKNYVKDRLYPLHRHSVALLRSPTTKTLGHDNIDFAEQAEKFLGKNYLKNNYAGQAQVSDDFVLLLLKHSTIRNKRYRYQVTDNSVIRNDDEFVMYPAPHRTTKHLKTGYNLDFVNDFMNVHSLPFQTTKRLKHFQTFSSTPEAFFIIDDHQNPKGRYFTKLNKKRRPVWDTDIEFEKRSIQNKRNQFGLSINNRSRDRPLKYKERALLSTKLPFKNIVARAESNTTTTQNIVELLFENIAKRGVKMEDMTPQSKPLANSGKYLKKICDQESTMISDNNFLEYNSHTTLRGVSTEDITPQSNPKTNFEEYAKNNSHQKTTILNDDNYILEYEYNSYTTMSNVNTTLTVPISNKRPKDQGLIALVVDTSFNKNQNDTNSPENHGVQDENSSGLNLNYYFSSPEDLIYERSIDNSSQTFNNDSNLGRRTFIDYLDLT